MNLAQLPKIELHLHLDCSLSLEAVQTLKPSVTAEEYQEHFVLDTKVTDLADFLRRVPYILNLLQTRQGLRVAVADLFKQLQADRVIYAEIRFAPLQHVAQGLSPTEVVEITAEALAENMARTGIEARLLLCTLRHFTEAQGLETVRLVEQFRDAGAAGLDLAADEAGFPITAHKAAFEYAHQKGIPCTAHAGEARGPESVWETLRELRPQRIGHGVRSAKDPVLVEHLRSRNIHLEVCPMCNVLIDVYPDYASHPVDRLHHAGVSVGINSDGRALPRVTLREEYQRLQKTFGWTTADFLQINLNALQAAFLPEIRKTALRKKLRNAYPIN